MQGKRKRVGNVGRMMARNVLWEKRETGNEEEKGGGA